MEGTDIFLLYHVATEFDSDNVGKVTFINSSGDKVALDKVRNDLLAEHAKLGETIRLHNDKRTEKYYQFSKTVKEFLYRNMQAIKPYGLGMSGSWGDKHPEIRQHLLNKIIENNDFTYMFYIAKSDINDLLDLDKVSEPLPKLSEAEAIEEYQQYPVPYYTEGTLLIGSVEPI